MDQIKKKKKKKTFVDLPTSVTRKYEEVKDHKRKYC